MTADFEQSLMQLMYVQFSFTAVCPIESSVQLKSFSDRKRKIQWRVKHIFFRHYMYTYSLYFIHNGSFKWLSYPIHPFARCTTTQQMLEVHKCLASSATLGPSHYLTAWVAVWQASLTLWPQMIARWGLEKIHDKPFRSKMCFVPRPHILSLEGVSFIRTNPRYG